MMRMLQVQPLSLRTYRTQQKKECSSCGTNKHIKLTIGLHCLDSTVSKNLFCEELNTLGANYGIIVASHFLIAFDLSCFKQSEICTLKGCASPSSVRQDSCARWYAQMASVYLRRCSYSAPMLK